VVLLVPGAAQGPAGRDLPQPFRGPGRADGVQPCEAVPAGLPGPPLPGVLWTPDGAAGTRPLILMGHGGGQHKKAPASWPVRAASRPRKEEHNRIIAEMRTRAQTGGELTPLLAGFHALLAGQTVPE